MHDNEVMFGLDLDRNISLQSAHCAGMVIVPLHNSP
jgi:hypothetical protein